MKSRFFIFVLLLAVFACNQVSETSEKKPVSKNGIDPPSELALLMRKMDSEMVALRNAITSGMEFPDSIEFNYEGILTVGPTDPSVRTDAFNSMANAFLASVKELKSAEFTDRDKLFNRTVQACVNCHGQVCPGPLVRIKKLPVPEV
jgi:hypothetical protein